MRPNAELTGRRRMDALPARCSIDSEAPRGQGGQPLALRLNDLLGHTFLATTDPQIVPMPRVPIDRKDPFGGTSEGRCGSQTQCTFVQTVGAEIA